MPSSLPLRLIPLGGLGEIGMNCMVVEQGERRFVLDCGVSFDGRGLGVDVIHPDFGYLRDAGFDAIVLTHGHEDHIGAVPFLLAERQVPIYGPPYALALLKERLAWHPGIAAPEVHAFAPGERFEIGPFEIEPYRVTHSMPDCTGLIIRTSQGVVVHSGDFKVDDDPTDGQGFDFARLARLRDEEGVRLFLSDSTNSLVDGSTGGERSVAEHLEEVVAAAPGRVVVTLFASNVHRLRALAQVARRTGRKLCLLGRSLEMHARLGEELGHLEDMSDLRIPSDLAKSIPRDQLLVLATGTQAEPPAAFARLGYDRHPDLRLEAGDLVIHSARIIPGHEQPVHDLINALERRGVNVLWRAVDPGIHVSGHAHRGEQRRLIEALGPRAFLPVHGTFMHLKHHAATARACGVEEIEVVENGAILELTRDSFRVAGQTATGRVHRHRSAVVPERVIDDRALLAELGVAIVTVVVDRRGRPSAPLELLTRGVLHEDEAQDALDDACEHVYRAFMRAKWVVDRPDEEDLEILAKRALKQFFGRRFSKKPLCYGVVMRVDEPLR